MWEDILVAAYVAFGFIGVFAFLPQLISLIKDTTRSENISLLTWSMWSSQVSIFFLYALFVVGDMVMIWVYLFSSLVCNACTGALLWNRYGRDLWWKHGHRFKKVTGPVQKAWEPIAQPVENTLEMMATPVVEKAWDAVYQTAPVEVGPYDALLPTELEKSYEEDEK